jgi:protein-tyrosine phosphatase
MRESKLVRVNQPSALTRSLQLTGATNFRDLGGYTGHDGRSVRWRVLFRSDHLGSLTLEDMAVLKSLGLQRVCDFRGVTERTAAACAMDGVAVHSLPIEPTVVQKLSALLAAGQSPGEAETMALMQDTYRAFVRSNTPRFKALFTHLLDSDSPLVFHCTAGKDRTGFAAAMILMSLGVVREHVVHDYLLTNEYLKASGSHLLPPEVASVLYRVREPFLSAALEAVQEDHGTIDAYLAQCLGIGPAERARLASMYLEPASGSR